MQCNCGYSISSLTLKNIYTKYRARHKKRPPSESAIIFLIVALFSMKLSMCLVELILRRNAKDGIKILARLKDIAICARYPIFNSEQRKCEFCATTPC